MGLLKAGRALAIVGCVLLLASSAVPQTSANEHDILSFLNQAIQWYRQIASLQQLASDASDALYASNLHDLSLEVLRNCFAFARAEAALKPAVTNIQQQPAASEGDNAAAPNAQNLSQLATEAQNSVKQSQDQLDALQKRLATAPTKIGATLRAQIAETRSELELAQARSETLNGFVQFLSTSVTGNHAGLMSQIDELERAVPELRAAPATTKKSATPENGTASPPAPAAERKQQASGIVGMIDEGFAFNAKLAAQRDTLASSAALRATMEKLRAPVLQELKATSDQGQTLSTAPDLTDPSAVQQRTQQLSALTARFKQNSAAVLPLGKALVLLDSVRGTLAEWRNDTFTAYRQELKRLVLRLFFLLIAVIAVFIASEIWRKATLRYVHEIRRRNQFMLLRRIAVSLAIALIVVFMLVTEIGSIATFAGFITAGLAVALQTVILSVVAYFLLIGKWGIRVGDRVSISGVTGDVIDIGLIRMHLLEVDISAAEEQPTGRVVVFSNAVLFQPTANFFKQIPGTSFTWHRITLTLAPETDYRRAEKIVMDAVSQVFADYQDDIKRQHGYMQETLTIPIKTPQPQSRFRFTDAGLELVVRYPVILDTISLIDDRVTRAVVQAIRSDPGLRLVKQGTPAIQPVPDTPHADKAA